MKFQTRGCSSERSICMLRARNTRICSSSEHVATSHSIIGFSRYMLFPPFLSIKHRIFTHSDLLFFYSYTKLRLYALSNCSTTIWINYNFQWVLARGSKQTSTAAWKSKASSRRLLGIFLRLLFTRKIRILAWNARRDVHTALYKRESTRYPTLVEASYANGYRRMGKWRKKKTVEQLAEISRREGGNSVQISIERRHRRGHHHHRHVRSDRDMGIGRTRSTLAENRERIICCRERDRPPWAAQHRYITGSEASCSCTKVTSWRSI